LVPPRVGERPEAVTPRQVGRAHDHAHLGAAEQDEALGVVHRALLTRRLVQVEVRRRVERHLVASILSQKRAHRIVLTMHEHGVNGLAQQVREMAREELGRDAPRHHDYSTHWQAIHHGQACQVLHGALVPGRVEQRVLVEAIGGRSVPGPGLSYRRYCCC
jgi:hypothetical protein